MPWWLIIAGIIGLIILISSLTGKKPGVRQNSDFARRITKGVLIKEGRGK